MVPLPTLPPKESYGERFTMIGITVQVTYPEIDSSCGVQVRKDLWLVELKIRGCYIDTNIAYILICACSATKV